MPIEQSDSERGEQQLRAEQPPEPRDFHSFSNPHEVKVWHLSMDLEVLFEEKMLHGVAVLRFDRYRQNRPLVLDTMSLKIVRVETSAGGSDFVPAAFSLGEPDPVLGSPLTIELPGETNRVRIEYFTHPGATGLQWLEPAQTAGKRRPFMFTQSETIFARSWIPLQDSPQVRLTYDARVRTSRDLLALMSAAKNPQSLGDGEYHFEMRQPIPSYLIALAVGDLAFKPLGPRSGVYAEPSYVERAAAEFEDTEAMMNAAERLYGPYLWDRYDILVLPPSFPLGGMENPRLTFATPTVLAGDKSLVSVIAHELAHSWSGNLVTNATWSDFWLNEGVTVYVERRIIEEVYGERRGEMEAALGRQELEEELASLDDWCELLHLDLRGRDPEECFTKVPYEKGALFLRQIEEAFGRGPFDLFLRGYFAQFAFSSITTAEFVDFLREYLLDDDKRAAASIPVDEWLYAAGIPESAPSPSSDAFAAVEWQADLWLRGQAEAPALDTGHWTTHEWLHFLRHLPKKLEPERMRQLDEAFGLTRSGNSEIAHLWLLAAIRSRYEPAYARLEEYLVTTGREKLIKPLYEELMRSPEGERRASSVYEKARPGYHPIVVAKLDRLLEWEAE